ncbi:DUF3883 domain-containing protein [Pseudomonas putida]|uniref:DUF3883 domain-containing protein n=1 Tax=Pseudomonas putida TaxID=303 RepID=UPI0014053795|nr:DUF3883 domain-containing protein [Pseudomonas putida]
MPQLSLLESSAIQAAMNEFSRLGRMAFLKRYDYPKSAEYIVRNPLTGDWCDLKAIVGVAFGKQFPSQGALGAESFAGVESIMPSLLTKLGFEVMLGEQDWSEGEVRSIVEDYFEMLRLEADDIAYNKSARNRMLREHLEGRNKSAVESKHRNISAVLDSMNLPFIRGYLPFSNSQSLLREAVQHYVKNHRADMVKIVDGLEEVKTPAQKSYSAVLVKSPVMEERKALVAPTRVGERLPRKLDYAARDDANRELGRLGEQWVVGYEKHRLTETGHPELAQQVEWISDSQGDGAGYDILSFESGILHRFIEVKATNGARESSFVVSRNELEFSAEAQDQFYLYRVFKLSSAPQLFILRGDLSTQLYLKPLDFRASFREHFG